LDRVAGLAALAPHLSGALRRAALQEAQDTLSKISDPLDRAKALGRLLASVPRPPRECLQEVLGRVTAIENQQRRAEALECLAPQLAGLELPLLYQVWRVTVARLATRTRPGFLSDLRTLTPVLHSVGGEQAFAEVFATIRDLGEWWV
jgi:hypothetical protein